MKIYVRCSNCDQDREFDDLGAFKCECGCETFLQVPGPEVPEKDKCSCGSGYGSYWENDGRGIPLCKVCVSCREEKLSKYNPVILGYYDENDVDEQIEDDY